MTDATSLLHITGGRIGYDRVQLLDDVSFQISRGECLGIWGRNGSGKSTLLRAFMGEAWSEAEISAGGSSYRGALESVTSYVSLSYLPQGRRGLPGLTVEENLRLAMWRISSSAEGSAQLLRLFKEPLFTTLESVLDLEVSFLSGGQDLLLGLAMIRLMDADLVLLDEPSDGLDLRNRDLTLAFVRTMRDEGKSIILIEQVLPVLFGCASSVAVIRGKKDPADSHYLQNTLAPLTEKQVEEVRGSVLADELDRTLSLLDLLAQLR